MFQLPTPGYQFMQLPQQKQQLQQAPGMSPGMGQQQNLMAMQAAQQQQPDPLAQANAMIKQVQQQNPNGLTAPKQDPSNLPVAPGMYSSQGALEKANGPLYDSPYQAQQGAQQANPFLQRFLGLAPGGTSTGSWLSSLLN